MDSTAKVAMFIGGEIMVMSLKLDYRKELRKSKDLRKKGTEGINKRSKKNKVLFLK